MASSDISDIEIYKKKLGLNYEIKQKYVGLKMKENNIVSTSNSTVKWQLNNFKQC